MASNVLPFNRNRSFASRMFGGKSYNFMPANWTGDRFSPRAFQRSSYDSNDVMTGIGLFALGAVVGAGIGLLFAPKSGQELRDDLGRMSGGARGMLQGANREPDMRMSPEYGTQTSSHPRR